MNPISRSLQEGAERPGQADLQWGSAGGAGAGLQGGTAALQREEPLTVPGEALQQKPEMAAEQILERQHRSRFNLQHMTTVTDRFHCEIPCPGAGTEPSCLNLTRYDLGALGTWNSHHWTDPEEDPNLHRRTSPPTGPLLSPRLLNWTVTTTLTLLSRVPGCTLTLWV